jgi:hypothetical protein
MNSNYIFFFSESDTNGYCSQWYLSPFTTLDGKHFTNAEQYMMYQKALLFKDEETAVNILKATHPRDVKKLGREVKNFSDDEWDQNKLRIVFEGNSLKFLQNPDIRKQLMNAYKKGKNHFVEASPYDAIWGIGFKEVIALKNTNRWGANYLGKILDSVAKCIYEFEQNLIKDIITRQISQYMSEAKVSKHEKVVNVKVANVRVEDNNGMTNVKILNKPKVTVEVIVQDNVNELDKSLNIDTNEIFKLFTSLYLPNEDLDN